MTQKSILVTAAWSGPGIAATKSLARAGFRVLTTDTRPLPLKARSRHSDSETVLFATDWRDFEHSLVTLVERLRPDVLLPIGSRWTLAASRNRRELSALTALNIPALEAFRAAFNKAVCMAECRRLGIPAPAVYSADEAAEVLHRDRDAALVVKPGFDAGGAHGVKYARSPHELKAAIAACEAQYGAPLIQDYIPGGSESMTCVMLLFSPQSQLVAGFAARKSRQWPQSGGLMAAGESIPCEPFVHRLLPFFEQWRWRGPAEVELKFDPRDGQDKVIEINPRFPAYLRFPVECGLDFPLLAARLALDRNHLPPAAYRAGLRYLNPGLGWRTLVDDLSHGRLPGSLALWTIPGAAAALRSVGHAVDDPLPFLGRCLQALVRPPEGALYPPPVVYE